MLKTSTGRDDGDDVYYFFTGASGAKFSSIINAALRRRLTAIIDKDAQQDVAEGNRDKVWCQDLQDILLDCVNRGYCGAFSALVDKIPGALLLFGTDLLDAATGDADMQRLVCSSIVQACQSLDEPTHGEGQHLIRLIFEAGCVAKSANLTAESEELTVVLGEICSAQAATPTVAAVVATTSGSKTSVSKTSVSKITAATRLPSSRIKPVAVTRLPSSRKRQQKEFPVPIKKRKVGGVPKKILIETKRIYVSHAVFTYFTDTYKKVSGAAKSDASRYVVTKTLVKDHNDWARRNKLPQHPKSMVGAMVRQFFGQDVCVVIRKVHHYKIEKINE